MGKIFKWLFVLIFIIALIISLIFFTIGAGILLAALALGFFIALIRSAFPKS